MIISCVVRMEWSFWMESPGSQLGDFVICEKWNKLDIFKKIAYNNNKVENEKF